MDDLNADAGGDAPDPGSARDLARQLYWSRREVRRLTLRVEELKSSWGYRLSAPVRLVERLAASLHKRSLSKNLAKAAAAPVATPLRGPRNDRAPADEYQDWIDAYDRITVSDLDRIDADIEAFPRRPLVSVLMLATPEAGSDAIAASLGSVRAQCYPDIELLIPDFIRPPLRESENIPDQRLRPVSLPPSPPGGIFNELLAQCAGEFVIALEPGCLLARTAVYLAVRAGIADPTACAITCDEDQIDADGRRTNPFFKPGWNPELALGFDYVGSAVVYRTDAVRAVGAADGASAAWRWDLLLRLADSTSSGPASSGRIARLPFVLFHHSTGWSETRQSETADGVTVVMAELARRGETAQVTNPGGPYVIVTRALPERPPHVSIIVATRDRSDLLRQCIAGLLHRTHYPDIDLIIVDNDSRETATAEYFATLRHDSRVAVIPYPKPFNYSAIHNMAVERAKGDVLAFVNNDIDVIGPHWLAEMVAQAVRPDVGVVGAKLYYPNDTIQHAGVVLGLSRTADHIFCGLLRSDPGPFGLTMVAQDMSAVTGACMVMRKQVFLDVGGMNPDLPVEFNDIDLCMKVRSAGMRVIWTPRAELYHHESATRIGMVAPRGSVSADDRFRARWRDVMQDDPFYNPNLSLADPYRVPAFPPRITRPWTPAGEPR